MKIILVLALVSMACLAFSPAVLAEEKNERIYEMRTYHASPDKLDPLNARFRDHTCKLFERHGLTNVGYWTPIENTDNILVYMVSAPGEKERKASWAKFIADPEWVKAFKESEANGSLVKKNGIDVLLLQATDYSPPIKPSKGEERVFELRTYTATAGKLDDLNARFRNHTCKLFEKHGMTNVGYWTPVKGQKGADNTLLYILAHKSVDAAKKSWEAFRNDPDWIAAKKASEEKAGGSLTEKDGVKSVYLKATDYSPIK
jgi:hypothetical protein